ncbi:MAG: hypothetical protein V4651_08240, partial [Bacteroidota bacterium]
KQALQNGAGIVDIINDNLGKAPAEIRALLKEKFPGLDEAKLENVVKQVCEMFNLPVTTLDEGITAIQAHIDKFDEAKWAVLSHSIASAFSILFAPPETKVKVFVSLIEYVYQRWFKKALPDTDDDND